MATKTKRAPGTRDTTRVASYRKRDPLRSLMSKGRLKNQDPTLLKFSPRGGIAFFDQILYQFPGVAGHCQAWVDHILVNELVIKPAKATNPADQELANEAAERATRAWARVQNRTIVLQKLLMARFYGFARAEKVWRFDPVVGEWIQDLYDVAQKYWQFDDDGREWLVSGMYYDGVEVDPSRFVHAQWGSADTKYGQADLGKVYVSLWTIQQLKDLALVRIQENESKIIVHYPRGWKKEDRDKIKATFAEHYGEVMLLPFDGVKCEVETPTQSVVSSGSTARTEYDAIAWEERQVQTCLLGAPQTGNKQLGTGKVEETRKAVWDDKTPLGLAALDQWITNGWLDSYCDMNLADLPLHLRPRFDSSSSDIAEGLSGIQSQEARNIALDLIAKRITLSIAIELWTALGIPRPRAQAMGDSAVKERDGLATADPKSTTPSGAAEPDAGGGEDDEQLEEAA